MVLVLAPPNRGSGEEIKNWDIVDSGMCPIIMVHIHTVVTGGLRRGVQGIMSLVMDGPGGRPEGWRYWWIVKDNAVSAEL